MKRFCIYLFIFFFPLISFASDPNEKIVTYDTNITVLTNASINVSEKIKVYADQHQIKHGIVRWFPIKYKDSYGINHHTDYEIKKILLNGVEAPYSIKRENNQFAVYIGDAKKELTPGYYTYTIDYRVKNAINFLKDGDELYWNVTGNNWNFPILSATAKVTLPEKATIVSQSGYTGITGAQGKNFTVTKPAPNEIIYTTNQTLPSGNGLTVAVAWPKGIVHQPTWSENLKDEFISQVYLFGSTLLLLLYYLWTWIFRAKAPKKGTIVPLFEPPAELSPGAVRYIAHMGVDTKTLTAAIVSMATKKFLTITKESDNFVLHKQENAQPTLSPDETSIASQFFAEKNTEFALNNSNSSEIDEAKDAMSSTLNNEYKNYFSKNTIYFVIGVLISLIAFAIAIATAAAIDDSFFAIVWLTGWTFGCTIIAIKTWKWFRLTWDTPSIQNILTTIGSFIFFIPFLIALIVCLYLFSDMLPTFTLPLLILVTGLNVVFYSLLRVYTPLGRKIMDQIEGFKLFLNTTERYRFNELYPPEKIPEMYEKFLPYAIALNVENRWSEKFNNYLRSIGTDPESYRPVWYVGPTIFTTGDFVNSFSNNLNSSLSSISVSSSSSASGGGGSSGGGGGGGGGGGW